MNGRREPRGRMWRTVRTVLTAVCIFGGAVTAQSVRDDVQRLLAEPCREWREVPTLQNSLVALGPEAAGELFEVYAARAIDNSTLGSIGLGRKRTVAVSGALELCGKDALFGHFVKLDHRASPRRRRAALDLASRLADPDDLLLLARLAAPERASPADVLRDEWVRSLDALLGRGFELVRQVARTMPQLAPALRPATIRFLGSCDTPASFHALFDTLGSVPTLDAMVLLEIHQGVRRGYRPVDWELRQLTNLAAEGSPQDRVLLAHLFEALRDPRTVPELLEMLDSSDGTVEPASRALSKIAVLNLPNVPEAWRLWHGREQSWHASRWSKCVHKLHRGDFSESAAALREMATHPLYAYDTVDELESILGGEDPELVKLGCSALAHLRVYGVERSLVQLLSHAHSGVRESAHKALQTITGAQLREDSAVWRQWLRERR